MVSRPAAGSAPVRQSADKIRDRPVLHAEGGTVHKAATYRGTVSVRYEGRRIRTLPLTIEVWPFAIPRRSTIHVTNWFNNAGLVGWHQCEPWSARHWRLLDLYAKTMAAYRQDTILTPTIFSYYYFSRPLPLVDVTRKPDGSYRFNMRKLERWIELFDRRGFRLFEMCHLLDYEDIHKAPPFYVHDERRGETILYEGISSHSRVYREVVRAFLGHLCPWLEKRGLTDRFLLHIHDEPQPPIWEEYARFSKYFRRLAPRIRFIDAMGESDLITRHESQIDIPVPLTMHLESDDYYRERARAGDDPVWWYTCCGPTGKYANRFVSMPLINGRLLFWQAHEFGVAGFLHWGYNFWKYTDRPQSDFLNPCRDHTTNWSVGDTCIVYPARDWRKDQGPNSSLRYEAMRAGLQDYELLKRLSTLVGDGNQSHGTRNSAARRRGKELLKSVKRFSGSLTEFSRDSASLYRLRRKIGECISTLQ